MIQHTASPGYASDCLSCWYLRNHLPPCGYALVAFSLGQPSTFCISKKPFFLSLSSFDLPENACRRATHRSAWTRRGRARACTRTASCGRARRHCIKARGCIPLGRRRVPRTTTPLLQIRPCPGWSSRRHTPHILSSFVPRPTPASTCCAKNR